MSRTDNDGRAYKGSQLQVQLYVNLENAALEGAIRSVLPGLEEAAFDWRSPTPPGYGEAHDARFLRLLGQDHLVEPLARFWPSGGAHWDALATVHVRGKPLGVLLGEGKGYPDEAASTIDRNTETTLRQRLDALAWARTELRATGDLDVHADPHAWTDGHYQHANRLAHRLWLERHGTPAFLVHLLFSDGNTSTQAWATAMEQARDALGLLRQPSGVGDVVLPSLGTARRRELPINPLPVNTPSSPT